MHLLPELDEETLLLAAQLRYKELTEYGQLLPAVSDTINPDQPPPWYDADKFKRAQRMAKKYFVSLYVSHLAGLLLVLQLPRGLAPLLATGNHQSIPRLFKRYISTQAHVKTWYEKDPFDPESKAFKSIRQVRAMHQNVCKLMNKKTGRVIGRDNIWVSQFDMALTQWAFVGLAILYPLECGMHPVSLEEMDEIAYFWRVLGYCHGIEDRFNLCAGSFAETYVYFKLVLNEVYKPICVQAPHPVPTGYEMTKGVVRALKVFNPSVRWTVFMKYWYDILGIPFDVEIVGRRNKFRYWLLKYSMNSLLKNSAGHWFFSSMFKANMRLQNSRKHTIERKLKERFPDAPYQKCPYSINLDEIDKAVI